MRSTFSHNRPRSGFTLLELLLALMIGVVLLGALSAAIHIQLNVATVSRTGVEEAQLARAVLRIIADDLHGTVKYVEVDMSGIESMLSGLSSASGLGASGDISGAGFETGGGESGEEGESNSDDDAEPAVEVPVLGLYGSQYDLRIDVRATPRADEIEAYFSGSLVVEERTDRLSEVKTVYYYVNEGMWSAQVSAQDSAEAGLVRSEVDRASLEWSELNGLYDTLIQEGKLLSTDVTRLEFRYFDGVDWFEEWDSEEQGVLPTAVEIALAVKSKMSDRQQEVVFGAPSALSADSQSDDPVYRLLVYLPGSELGGSNSDSASNGSSGDAGSGDSGSGGNSSFGDASSGGGSSGGAAGGR